jgi:hypothetical protein
MTAPTWAATFRDAVWADDQMSTVQAIVALCYANHAQGGDRAWLTYPRLMEQTKIRSKGTASAAIKALVAAGWLRPVGLLPGHRQIVIYRLEVPTGTAAVPVDGPNRYGSRTGTGTEPVRQTAKPVHLGPETGTAPVPNSLDPQDSLRGAPPPARCGQHRDRPAPGPCLRCRDARLAREAWEAERRDRIDLAPKCPHHRGELAHNCGPCRSEAIVAARARPAPPPAAAATVAAAPRPRGRHAAVDPVDDEPLPDNVIQLRPRAS